MSEAEPTDQSNEPTLQDRIASLENRMEVVLTRLKNAEEELQDEREAREVAEQRVETLQARVDELEGRTSLLDRVEKASVLKPDQRAAVLIQTLSNKAQRGNSRASMTYKQADAALAGDLSRPQVYDAMKRAARLVDDEDVVWYQKEPRSAVKDSRLILDLEKGTLPNQIGDEEVR